MFDQRPVQKFCFRTNDGENVGCDEETVVNCFSSTGENWVSVNQDR